MAQHWVIVMTFQNQYPGQYPGQLGLLTKEVIQFYDLEGKVTALDGKIREAKRKAYLANDRALSFEGRARRFWAFLALRRRRKEKRLLEQARSLTLKMLRGDRNNLLLKGVWDGSSDGFCPVKSSSRKAELLEGLATAKDFWFYILEPI